jgi:hypothetical protein
MSSVELGDELGQRKARCQEMALSWPYERVGLHQWRYEWGPRVPGARDLTLQELYGFDEAEGARGPVLLVPVDAYQDDARLAWVAAYWDPRAEDREHIAVPASSWATKTEILGMYAPELAAGALLDTEASAQLAGCSPRTISNYLARGDMPAPVVRAGGSPLWPRPLLRHWLEVRPGRRGRPRRPTLDLLQERHSA